MKSSRVHKLLFLSPQPYHLQPEPARVAEILTAARNVLTDATLGHSAAFTICQFAQQRTGPAAEWIARYSHYARFAQSKLETDNTSRRAAQYHVEDYALEWCITGRALPLQMLSDTADADKHRPELAALAVQIIDALQEGPEPWREQLRAHLDLVNTPARVATVAVTRPSSAEAARYLDNMAQLNNAYAAGTITLDECERQIEAMFATAEPAPFVGYIYGGPQSSTLYDEAKNYLGQLAPGDLQLPLELCQAAEAEAQPTPGEPTE